MATNFTLAYNNGAQYVDLFLETSLAALILEGAFQIVTLNVEIPATTNDTQTVSIVTDSKMPTSMFRLYLDSTDPIDISNYNTITQAQVLENQLVLTYLYNKPSAPINVTLVFLEKIE